MTRWAVLFLAAVLTASGQFSDLASTDDGSQLYFSSPLRLKGTNQFLHSKIFRVGPGPVELVAQRERVRPIPPTNAFLLHSPQVSGDGSVLTYTATLDCGPGSSCLLREVNYSTVHDLRTGRVREISGTVRLSRNGRYALVGSRQFPNPPGSLLDLETGESTPMLDAFRIAGSGRRAVSSTGVAVAVGARGELFVAHKTGSRTLTTAQPVREAVIDDQGTTAVCATQSGGLVAVSLGDRREKFLAGGDADPRPALSNDGRLALFLSQGQVHLVGTDGTGLRQLTTGPEEVVDAALSGNGAVVHAATGNGRLLRIDAVSGGTSEVFGRTPFVTGTAGAPSPGSLFSLLGRGLADRTEVAQRIPLPTELAGVEVTADGRPVPLIRVSPGEIRFQVPWNLPAFPFNPSNRPVAFEAPSDSPFAGLDERFLIETCPKFEILGPEFPLARQYSSYILAVHDGQWTVVTPDNPLRAGETIHVYMTGLGPVSSSVADGVAAPSDPPAAAIRPLACRFVQVRPAGGGNRRLEATVLWVGLAPGLVGVYQVTVRVPENIASPGYEYSLLECTAGNCFSGGAVPHPAPLPPRARGGR